MRKGKRLTANLALYIKFIYINFLSLTNKYKTYIDVHSVLTIIL